jgi:hypothetical protein
MGHREQRSIQPQAFHEVGQRLADHGLEHAVKVERRQHRGVGDVIKPQALPEMTDNVVDREIDPLDVGQRSRSARFHVSSQDLSRLRRGAVHPDVAPGWSGTWLWS